MFRKLNSVSALFSLMVLALAASSAIAQGDRLRPAPDNAGVKLPTLGCCKCLGGTNTLDLSTITTNYWTVNGNAAVFLGSINSYWNINPGPAKWVSTVTTGGVGNVNAGTYDYKLKFFIPQCVIGQRVTLAGNYGGDDDVYIYLDNTTTPIAQCTGGWCFNTPQKTLSTFNTNVGPGPHTLIVRINNSGPGPSPSGMFVNAKLTGACNNELTETTTAGPDRNRDR